LHVVAYNLSHLTQPDDQAIGGPIQDDEGLFLFALIRCMRLRRVLEIGGLGGYSARNFLAAVGPSGVVYTVDVNPVPRLADNHITIQRDCRTVGAKELGSAPIDLVFFDCHAYEPQMTLLKNLQTCGVVHDRTVLSLHDTNTHPRQFAWWAFETADGWVHQVAERKMVNELRNDGYEALMLHPDPSRHDGSLPFRHGITILSRNRYLLLDPPEGQRVPRKPPLTIARIRGGLSTRLRRWTRSQSGHR
jgi:O-methyltransferase